MTNNKETIQKSAALLKVLGDPTRLSILSLLSEKEANVSTIVEELDGEQSNISHQLKILKDNHLVRSERAGKSVVYCPDDSHIYGILDQIFKHVKEFER